MTMNIAIQNQAAEAIVPDTVDVALSAAGRALVISDLHLGAGSSDSGWAVSELTKTITEWEGPGVVFLAGDTFELSYDGEDSGVDEALDACPVLTGALKGFAGEGRHLICLVGNHDGRLAWDFRAADAVRRRMGAQLALSAELSVETAGGRKLIRVEHGHRLDPLNAFSDPRNPSDTPLGHHVTTEVLPAIKGPAEGWLDGAKHLVNPAAFPKFVASRLIYRRMVRHIWWVALPFAIALALKLPVLYAFLEHTGHRSKGLGTWSHRLTMVGLAAIADLTLIGGALFLSARRVWTAVGGIIGVRGQGLNAAARKEAAGLAQAGYSGLVTGHTHRHELMKLDNLDGFYANAGSGSEIVAEQPARFGLPPVFLTRRQVSWVEVEGGAELGVRLVQGHQANDNVAHSASGTRLERMLARTDRSVTGVSNRPGMVAAYPAGPFLPNLVFQKARARRVRSIAAAAVALAGVLNLVSVLLPPFAGRFGGWFDLMPLVVHETAAAAVALSGIGLLFLARILLKGQRFAWMTALALLIGSAFLHLAKGVDIEDALAAIVIALYLMRNGSVFSLKADRQAARRGIAVLLGGSIASSLIGAISVEMLPASAWAGARLPLRQALLGVAERLVWIRTVALPRRFDFFGGPALAAVGVLLCIIAARLFLRVETASSPGEDA